MKKSIIKILCLSIISMSVLGLGGCGEDTESSSQPTTQAPATTVEATTASLEVPDDFDVATLHYYDEESKDPFAGAWKITGGSGAAAGQFHIPPDPAADPSARGVRASATQEP